MVSAECKFLKISGGTRIEVVAGRKRRERGYIYSFFISYLYTVQYSYSTLQHCNLVFRSAIESFLTQFRDTRESLNVWLLVSVAGPN